MDVLKLIEYNIWANRLVGKQIESLPPELFGKQIGGSFGSIKATVTHVLESDWLWLNRFKGIPLAKVPSWQIDNASNLYREWKIIQEDMLAVGRVLAVNKNQKIAFVTRKGLHYELPFEDIIMHVANHGTYHRGQLTDMIRLVGGQPVSTDYFIFCTQ
jgi:uncharacterized damage-inducible protein DinB